MDDAGMARRLLEAHETAWADRWTCSDIVVEGDEEAQKALRFTRAG
jgi:trehalose/maltose hydrolase-like predicted phosphorylase